MLIAASLTQRMGPGKADGKSLHFHRLSSPVLPKDGAARHRRRQLEAELEAVTEPGKHALMTSQLPTREPPSLKFHFRNSALPGTLGFGLFCLFCICCCFLM